MNDTEKTVGLVAVIIAAVLFLRWWSTRTQAMSPAVLNVGGGGAPAYVSTAADNSISVVGVPEDTTPNNCPGKSPAPGAKSEGGYGCK